MTKKAKLTTGIIANQNHGIAVIFNSGQIKEESFSAHIWSAVKVKYEKQLTEKNEEVIVLLMSQNYSYFSTKPKSTNYTRVGSHFHVRKNSSPLSCLFPSVGFSAEIIPFLTK